MKSGKKAHSLPASNKRQVFSQFGLPPNQEQKERKTEQFAHYSVESGCNKSMWKEEIKEMSQKEKKG